MKLLYLASNMIPIGRKLYIRETRSSKLDPSEKSDQSLPDDYKFSSKLSIFHLYSDCGNKRIPVMLLSL